jgi:uncharacterized protein YgbK (DUF1537 family)
MPTVRILADDLTGALDSAVRFCGDAGPLPVRWTQGAMPEDGSLAFSAETRALDESTAAQHMAKAASRILDTKHLCFRKIDSLLRGHVAAELAAILRGGSFDAVVLAPAYPALGRATRRGRQYVRSGMGDRFELTGPDLTEELLNHGVVCFSDAERVRGSSEPAIWLADAESDDDLRNIVGTALSWEKRTLWCGTGGLAGALAVRPEPELQPEAGAFLIVSGTNHPVALSQMAELAEHDRDGVIACRRGAGTDAAGRINRRLAAGRWAALTPDLPDMATDEAASAIESMLAHILPHVDRPDAMFVMGGETLHACCAALGAETLSVRGSVAAGIPVSTLGGGAWDGATVYSKSGAFGDALTVAALVRRSAAWRGPEQFKRNEARRP